MEGKNMTGEERKRDGWVHNIHPGKGREREFRVTGIHRVSVCHF